MILLTLLTMLFIGIVIVVIVVIIGLGITGIAGIIVFGDVIVCVGLIIALIRHLIKRKK